VIYYIHVLQLQIVSYLNVI